MNSKIKLLKPCFIASFSALLVACQTIENETKLPSLNRAEAILDEWGAITASVPIISIPSEEFKFSLDKSADEFYKNAKEEVNAGVAQHTQTVFSLLLAGSSQNDPLNQNLFSQELSQYQTDLSAYQANTQLSDEQKVALQKSNSELALFYTQAAGENYTACVAVADAEKAAADKAATVAEQIQLNNASVQRRKTCLDDYQAEIASLATASPTKPTYPSLPDNNIPDVKRLVGTPFGSKNEISADFSNKDKGILSQSYALPDHAAIPQAATYKFLSEMFKNISDNKDGQALFGVTMVSINPGWRTNGNYRAVINIEPKIVFERATQTTTEAYLKDAKISDEFKAAIAINYGIDCSGYDFKYLCDEKYSLLNEKLSAYRISDYSDIKDYKFEINTTAISPVTYAQNTDLQNRQISQINLSLMLAASLRNAGVGQSAEVFAEYSRQRRKEFGSRNAINNVSVYSSGQMVGVEVAPEFLAANPDNNDSKLVLQSQTFPMLLRFEAEQQGSWNMPIIASNCGPKEQEHYCLLEPKFEFTTTSRWKTNEGGFWSRSKKLLKAETLYDVKEKLEKECNSLDDAFIHTNCEELRSKLFGQVSYVNLPKTEPRVPSFAHIFPVSATIKRDKENKIIPLEQTFVLSGEYLDELAKGGTIDLTDKLTPVFAQQSVKKATIIGGSLVVDMTFADAKGPVMFTIEHQGKTIHTAHSKNTLAQISVAPKKAPTTPKTPVVFDVSQDTKNNSTKVTLSPGTKDLPEVVGKVLDSMLSKHPKPVVTPPKTN